MDLTPEDKHRIYLEEKARLEAQEQIKTELAQKKIDAEARTRKQRADEEREKASNRHLGYSVMAIIFIAVVFIAYYRSYDPLEKRVLDRKLDKVARDNASLAKPSVPSSPKTNNAAFEACRNKLIQAQKLDLLYDLKFEGPSPQIFVGPTWYTLPLDAKEGFHDTVQCFVNAGGGGVNVSTQYRDWRTGKIVAEVAYTGGLKILQ